MKNGMKKLLSLLLCLVFIFSMIPAAAYAEDTETAMYGQNEPALSDDAGSAETPQEEDGTQEEDGASSENEPTDGTDSELSLEENAAGNVCTLSYNGSDTGYATLQGAINDAPNGEYCIITLNDAVISFPSSDRITVPANKKIELNLNNNYIYDSSSTVVVPLITVSGELVIYGAGRCVSVMGNALKITGGSVTVSITGGTLNIYSPTVSPVQVDSGSFSLNSGIVEATGQNNAINVSSGSVAVTGGSVMGSISAGSGSVSLSGGEYSVQPNAAYIAQGYACCSQDSTDYPYAVQETVCTLTVGTTVTDYTSVAAAVTAAGSSQATIKLLKDVDTSISIGSGQNIGLDLNGKSVSVTGGSAIVSGGTLTVGGGSIISSTDCAIAVNAGSVTVAEDATTIRGQSNSNAEAIAIYVSGGSLSVTGGKIGGKISKDTAGTVSLTGGKYKTSPDSSFVPAGYDISASGDTSYPFKVAPHVHNWRYALRSGRTDTVTATCTCDIAQYPLKISGPLNAVYNGNAHNASFDALSFCGGPLPYISYYYKASAGGSYVSVSDTKNAGYYKASFTVGEFLNMVIAYTEYTVSRATPTSAHFSFAGPASTLYDGNPKSATVTPVTGISGMGEVTVGYYTDASCQTQRDPGAEGTCYVGITVAEGTNFNASNAVITDSEWKFTVAKAGQTEADYTVNYYLAGTTVKVADSVPGSALIGSSVTVSAPTLYSAYANAVKLSGDASFVVATGDNTVNWYYQVPLTVTAADESKSYDGTVLTKANIASIAGLVNGDTAAMFGATMTSDSTITNVGTKANKIATLTYNGGTVPAYYKVTKKDGTLEIIPLPITVRITGHTLETDYNGQVQKVEGYDWWWFTEEPVTVATNLYTENDFTLSGEAVIERMNVNRALPTDPVDAYMMGLDNSRFTNVNNNFTVTFDVADGSLTIKPINARVVVTPNPIEEKYTGEEKKITETVTKKSKGPLYDPEKLSEHPTDGWTRTVIEAGTYDFDIKPEDFQNTDPNFERVEVTVEQNKPLVVMPKLTVRYWLGGVGGEQAASTAERWAAGGTEVNVVTPNIVGWQPNMDRIKWTAPKDNLSEGESETTIDVVFNRVVDYIGADQTAKTLNEPYTIIDSNNMPPIWNAGWYVVQGTVNYPTGGITCNGAVHLILTDGCSLSVKGADSNAGICVIGTDNFLTVYGQSGGTGKLDATGSDGGAGIGGGSSGNGSNITINGGTVTATGSDGGAGIGGGSSGNGSSITINGGIVTATGGDTGAGIGGGFAGSGSNIKISGGTVTATGGDRGAGIGGGDNGIGGGSNITINGGTVTATGSDGGAGIGGGYAGAGNNITIDGGTVTATSIDGGAGIGGGGDNGDGSNITINGGTVKAGGGTGGAGIGGGYFGSGSNITINGGTVTATGGDRGAGIGGGWTGSGSHITISGGCINATGKNGGEDIGSGKYGSAASGIELKGGCYANKPDSKYIPDGYYSGNNTDTATKADYPYIIQQAAGCLVLDGDYPGTFSADGEELEADCFKGKTYIKIPDGAKVLTYYEFHAGSDAHGTYPVSMKVWLLSYDAGSGKYTASAFSALDNLLSYHGTSIRTSGKRGVRVVTGIDEALKKQLISGLNGYKLTEYGTVMAWTKKLNGDGLTLEHPDAVHNFAYSAAGGKDPVYRQRDGRIWYTNVLLLDNLTDEWLKEDITMRPYLKLSDGQGNELVIYGGEVLRSVGYVAYQNRSAFRPGTAEYEYIWDIIHKVYGSQYDSEYVKK